MTDKPNVFFIHQNEGKRFWLEVPRCQHSENKCMWFRTLHSPNTDYFGWVVLEDGSIQSCKNPKLVLGYGVSKHDEHFRDFTNEKKWHKNKIPECLKSETEGKQE